MTHFSILLFVLFGFSLFVVLKTILIIICGNMNATKQKVTCVLNFMRSKIFLQVDKYKDAAATHTGVTCLRNADLPRFPLADGAAYLAR